MEYIAQSYEPFTSQYRTILRQFMPIIPIKDSWWLQHTGHWKFCTPDKNSLWKCQVALEIIKILDQDGDVHTIVIMCEGLRKSYNWYNNPKSNRTTPQLNKQNSSNGFQSFPLPKNCS